MRVMDRVGVVIGGLLLIMLVTVVLLAPESIMLLLAGVADVNLLLRLALVVVVNILILAFMYTQLRGRHKTSTGLAVKASGAYTDVNVESARALILNGVKSVKDVVSADVKVEAVNGLADVDLNVHVTGNNIHIPNKQKEIDRALRQVINKQLGLQMRGKPRVHISLQGETPPVPAPVVVEKKPEPLPEKPSLEPKPVVADQNADTLEKVDKPQGFLGLRNREEAKPDEQTGPKSSGDDDWPSSFDKEKAEDKQN